MICLASGSPRRHELLQQIGVQHHVDPADIDETPWPNEPAQDYVTRLSREKALAVLHRRQQQHSDTMMPVLAADTSVVLNSNILGKPTDADDAASMLQQLSGRQHQVMTGVAMARWQVHDKSLQSEPELQCRVVITNVQLRALSDAEIAAYIATGEPMDKAGSYGIQGKAAIFVASIEGSYSNVVGLPLAETADMLQHWQVPLF